MPLIHKDNPVGHLGGKFHFVGNDEHAHALARQLQHHIQHLAHHFRVERGGDFIQQDHFRVHAQRAHDGDALFLPAGKLAREGGFAVEQAHAGQQLVGLRLHFFAATPLCLQRAEQDVVDHIHVGKQFIALKHHAHFLAGGFPRHVFAEFAHAFHFDAAALVRLQAVDAAQQGAFAAARRAQNHHHLTLLQAQIQILQHHGIAVALAQVAHVQQSHISSPISFPNSPPAATAASSTRNTV